MCFIILYKWRENYVSNNTYKKDIHQVLTQHPKSLRTTLKENYVSDNATK